jgi:hypothetical protein
MPISTRYLFTASMDVDPDKEALFDEVYDQEHVPNLLKVPGVISVTRLEPKHSAVYEIESPEVLVSREWGEAVEAGRWPAQVRPHTSNRRHTLRKVTKTAP